MIKSESGSVVGRNKTNTDYKCTQISEVSLIFFIFYFFTCPYDDLLL